MSVLVNNSQSLQQLQALRSSGRRVVFTNGCFDLIHIGHTRYLADARRLGDLLVVGINSDASVRRLKGASRPIVPEAERREVLLALKSVDLVFVFETDTPLELIKEIRPDILVKGGDWPVDKIVGADFVLANGGEVHSLPFHQGHSTSEMIAAIEQKLAR